MFTFTRTLTTAAMILMAANSAAQAQDGDAALAGAIMASDGTDTDVAAATGWHVCSVVRTGAGWGNHYVALTCPTMPAVNQWHIMKDDQKDAMLATALTAATGNIDVQVYAATGSGSYKEIRALYLHK